VKSAFCRLTSLMLLVSGLAIRVLAQGVPSDSTLNAMTRALASELRCPVCQGLSLQDSPSDLAQQMRAVIRDQLKAGKTPDEVRAYFLEKYGEWILLEPKPNGVNLLVYVVPILAVLGGLIVVGGAVRKWTATPAGAASDARQPVVRAPDD